MSTPHRRYVSDSHVQRAARELWHRTNALEGDWTVEGFVAQLQRSIVLTIDADDASPVDGAIIAAGIVSHPNPGPLVGTM